MYELNERNEILHVIEYDKTNFVTFPFSEFTAHKARVFIHSHLYYSSLFFFLIILENI